MLSKWKIATAVNITYQKPPVTVTVDSHVFWDGNIIPDLGLGHKHCVSTDYVIMQLEKISNHKFNIRILFMKLDRRLLLSEQLPTSEAATTTMTQE